MKTVLIVCLLLMLIGCDPSPGYEVRMKYNLRGDTLYYLTSWSERGQPGIYAAEGNRYESHSYAKVDSVRNAWAFQHLVNDSMRYRYPQENLE